MLQIQRKREEEETAIGVRWLCFAGPFASHEAAAAVVTACSREGGERRNPWRPSTGTEDTTPDEYSCVRGQPLRTVQQDDFVSHLKPVIVLIQCLGGNIYPCLVDRNKKRLNRSGVFFRFGAPLF